MTDVARQNYGQLNPQFETLLSKPGTTTRLARLSPRPAGEKWVRKRTKLRENCTIFAAFIARDTRSLIGWDTLL